MRQVARKGLITIAAAGGLLATAGGYAHADAGAQGGAANSPGVGSGNSVQVPVHVPVNACGNTADVVGLLNPSFGNHCANDSGKKSGHHADQSGKHHDQGGKHQGGSGTSGSGTHGSGAQGGTANSPGVGSGNNIQAPIDVPVNACGNTVSVVGLLNPALGNDCGNDTQTVPPTSPEYPEHPEHPDKPTPPKEQPPEPEAPGPHPQTGNEPHTQIVSTPKPVEQLAQTGAGPIGYAVPAAAGLLLGGAVLYRRARTARR